MSHFLSCHCLFQFLSLTDSYAKHGMISEVVAIVQQAEEAGKKFNYFEILPHNALVAVFQTREGLVSLACLMMLSLLILFPLMFMLSTFLSPSCLSHV
jgi:hypothetical protein